MIYDIITVTDAYVGYTIKSEHYKDTYVHPVVACDGEEKCEDIGDRCVSLLVLTAFLHFLRPVQMLQVLHCVCVHGGGDSHWQTLYVQVCAWTCAT